MYLLLYIWYFHIIIYVHAYLFVNIGRVLNRFSKDIGLMDAVLPYQFVDFITVSYKLKNPNNLSIPKRHNITIDNTSLKVCSYKVTLVIQ